MYRAVGILFFLLMVSLGFASCFIIGTQGWFIGTAPVGHDFGSAVYDRPLLTKTQKDILLNKGEVTVEIGSRTYTFTPSTLPDGYLFRE